MTKNKKIIFNLSIDDLKELGIIKPKRRRKNKKLKQYIQLPNNIKSSSDHMVGYSNTFNSTPTLQSENLRLQNNILEKYPMIKNEDSNFENRLIGALQKYPLLKNDNNNSNDYENRLNDIENDNIKHKALTQHILQLAYGSDNNRPMTSFSGIRNSPQVEELPNNNTDDDNIDVATTGGSDSFKSYNHDNNNSYEPNTIQSGIRNPSIDDNSIAPQLSLEDFSQEVMDELDSYNTQDQSKKEKEKENEKKLKKQIYNQERKDNLYLLKQKYTKLGGNNVDVLRSQSISYLQGIITALETQKSAAEKLAVEKLAAEQLESQKLAAEKLAAEKLAAEQLSSEKPKSKSKSKKNKK
jgi:hypothetical protein